jgi:hypothetical protein
MADPDITNPPAVRGELATLKEVSEALASWSGLSWVVAVAIGLWGVFLGVGEFPAAYWTLVVTWLLCSLRWGYHTGLFKGDPRTVAFTVGLMVLIAVAASMAWFTHYRNRKADEQGNQLSQLNGIPSLQRKVAELTRANNALAESVLNAQQEAATKAGVIQALQSLVLRQEKENGVIGIGTDKDFLGEPADSARGLIQFAFSSGDFQVFVENTGSRNMFDVSITVEELSLSQEQKGFITEMKRRNRKSEVLSSIRPRTLAPTSIHLPYLPPNCDGWRIAIATRGGGESQTIYRRIGGSKFDPRAKPQDKPDIDYQFFANGKLVVEKTVRIKGANPF